MGKKDKIRALIVEDPHGDLYASVCDSDECYFIPTNFSMGAFAGDIVLMHVRSATRKNDLRPQTTGGRAVTQYAIVDSIENFSECLAACAKEYQKAQADSYSEACRLWR